MESTLSKQPHHRKLLHALDHAKSGINNYTRLFLYTIEVTPTVLLTHCTIHFYVIIYKTVLWTQYYSGPSIYRFRMTQLAW